MIKRQRRDCIGPFWTSDYYEPFHYSRIFIQSEGSLSSSLKHSPLALNPPAANGFQSGRKFIINDAHLMTISYVWPRAEEQNDDFNENHQIEPFMGQLSVNLFKVLD